MLTLLGAKQRFCDGITRRNFLKLGALGSGLHLANVLRGGATAAPAPTPAKSVIMIVLEGGPPHLDMYDLKPDAPVEFRGEFKPIRTNVPGADICELLPLQAQMWDKLAVIRSVHAENEHSDSQIMTGYPERTNQSAHHPPFGAVLSKLRGSSRQGVPAFASLTKFFGGGYGLDGGFLGSGHRPFMTTGEGLDNMRLREGMTIDRLNDRKALLSEFDTLRRDIDVSGALAGLDACTAQAFDMVVSGAVRQALDLSREELRSRERYKGVEHFLTARRLIEAGVRCVTFAPQGCGWDTHSDNFKTMRKSLPLVDRGLTNLIQDLHDRGLDKDVVTVMWGEFGRAPKIDAQYGGGRGHWPPAMSVLIAGGGLKMGQVIGSTSARAEFPKERPYSVQQVMSTIYRAMDIDPALTLRNTSGRPVNLLDDREPVSELL